MYHFVILEGTIEILILFDIEWGEVGGVHYQMIYKIYK